MQVAPSVTKFGNNATNSSATEINLEIFYFATEFVSFVAVKIIQVIEAMPGSVVPLAMFFLMIYTCRDDVFVRLPEGGHSPKQKVDTLCINTNLESMSQKA